MERLIPIQKVEEIVLYSKRHLYRLEAAGLFPKRIKLGPSKTAYSELEIVAWLADKKAAAKGRG